MELPVFNPPCFTMGLLPVASSKTGGSYHPEVYPNPDEARGCYFTYFVHIWVTLLASAIGKSERVTLTPFFLIWIAHRCFIHWQLSSVPAEIPKMFFTGLHCIRIRLDYSQQSAYWHFKSMIKYLHNKRLCTFKTWNCRGTHKVPCTASCVRYYLNYSHNHRNSLNLSDYNTCCFDLLQS